MKRIMIILLAVAAALLFLVPAVSAAGEGTETVKVKGSTLSIKQCGFENDDHTSYSVTVGGYNVLLSGKSGNILDMMTFRLAIAWSPDDYIVSSSFGITIDPVTIGYFSKKDGSPMEEPLYIIIAPKGTDVKYGYYYVIAEGKFRDGTEIAGTPAPTATPRPTNTPRPTATPVPTPIPAHDPLAEPEAIRTAGEYVTFGRYPQTKDGKDETPIEWLVLDYDEENQRVLLLSRYGLDAKAYHSKEGAITWEKCSLRKWLNNGFMELAFKRKEQKAILVTKVENGKEQGYQNIDGGKDTEDQVFLLSFQEANRYFGVQYNEENMAARMHPTDYAVGKGIDPMTYSSFLTEYGETTADWWLRSPGKNPECAMEIHAPGEALNSRYARHERMCIRPAIWVDLNAAYFN